MSCLRWFSFLHARLQDDVPDLPCRPDVIFPLFFLFHEIADFFGQLYIVRFRSLKLSPPMSSPIGGITTSDTNEVTIFPNAPPMITPTAMSITFSSVSRKSREKTGDVPVKNPAIFQ